MFYAAYLCFQIRFLTNTPYKLLVYRSYLEQMLLASQLLFTNKKICGNLLRKHPFQEISAE
jgi:hypothetical protein